MSEILIKMSGIQKHFGNVHAVKDASFELKRGEIHSIVGENGAGKSTMMKLLYGLYEADAGVISIMTPSGMSDMPSVTPAEAISLGIGMVHQEFMLVREMTVLENVILGFEPRRGLLIDTTTAARQISHYGETYGLNVQLNSKIREISVGEEQRVEIIKILYRGAKIIILDEPTAVLTPQESRQLFKILESMKNDGKSIVFISHKLDEVMQISDRITVMRQGKHVATVERKDTSIPEIARMMVGRDVFLSSAPEPATVGKIVLEVEAIYVPGEKELSKLRGLSFDLREGEILGIAGVDGNGQSELVEAIAGLRPVEKGRVVLNGVEVQKMIPLRRREIGLCHIPEDRNTTGLNRAGTIKENLIATSFRNSSISSFGVMLSRQISAFADSLIEKFDVRPAQAEASVSGLSGGNAQKVVIAREMSQNSSLLIASQPTRGVDIGSIETIRRELNNFKRAGKSVLLVSSDLEEILALSDRIAVMYEGKITGIVNSGDADVENIGLLMTGGARGNAHV